MSESITSFDDERGHATKLIERMLFLEGTPDMTKRTGFKVGKDVPEMLESDLRVEYEVDAKLREVIALCETEKDYVTRDMLIVLLDDTEMDHAHWLEQQLGLIKRIGLSNYLQSQNVSCEKKHSKVITAASRSRYLLCCHTYCCVNKI